MSQKNKKDKPVTKKVRKTAQQMYADETRRRQEEIQTELKNAKFVDGVYYIRPYV